MIYNKEVQTATIEEETHESLEDEIRLRISKEREQEAERVAREKELEEEAVKLEKEIEQEIRGLLSSLYHDS
jgi:dynein intermediate chain, cytosolic